MGFSMGESRLAGNQRYSTMSGLCFVLDPRPYPPLGGFGVWLGPESSEWFGCTACSVPEASCRMEDLRASSNPKIFKSVKLYTVVCSFTLAPGNPKTNPTTSEECVWFLEQTGIIQNRPKIRQNEIWRQKDSKMVK